MFLRDICNQPSCKLSQKQTELQLSMRLSRGHPVLSVPYVTRGGKASLHSAMTQDDNDFVYSAGIFCLLLFSTKSFLVFIDFLSIFIIIHTFFTTAQNFNICVLHLKKKKTHSEQKKNLSCNSREGSFTFTSKKITRHCKRHKGEEEKSISQEWTFLDQIAIQSKSTQNLNYPLKICVQSKLE